MRFVARLPGMLTGKYDKDNLPAGPRGLLFRSILPGIEPLTDLMRQIAASRRKTVSQVREIYYFVYMCAWPYAAWPYAAAVAVAATRA